MATPAPEVPADIAGFAACGLSPLHALCRGYALRCGGGRRRSWGQDLSGSQAYADTERAAKETGTHGMSVAPAEEAQGRPR